MKLSYHNFMSRPVPGPTTTEEPDLLSFFDPSSKPTAPKVEDSDRKVDVVPGPPIITGPTVTTKATPSTRDDELIAQMMADEMFTEQMRNDPDFVAYLQAGESVCVDVAVVAIVGMVSIPLCRYILLFV